MCYTHLNRKCELEECGLDFPEQESVKKDYPQLMLVDKANQLEENLPSSLIQADDEAVEASPPPEENDKEPYSDPQSGLTSSLVIYFKTINRFPLLKEEEERTLAKLIKESEEECKNLVIKWKHLFKREFLRRFSNKQMKEISKKLQLLNGSFTLFDDLTKLERERKKSNLAIKRLAHRSNTRQELKGTLYKIEAEISKCIAEIIIRKTSINRIISTLKKIPHSKKNIKKQHMVEKELRGILREIGHTSKEIKLLKNKLIQANLRLVISIAKKYAHHGLTLPDLIQEGNLGLMRAIDTYDYRRGHRFITYATWWIKQAIIRALDCQSRTIRTPVYINEKLNQIVKASNRLLQKYKREPTLKEIAEETNIPLESIEKVIQSFKDPIDINDFIEEKGGSVTNPSLDLETISILEQVTSSNLSQITDVVLSDLTQREREIVKLRFGIGKEHDHTLEEIGGEFNLSRERIRQILEVALNKLRNPKYLIKLKDFMDFN